MNLYLQAEENQRLHANKYEFNFSRIKNKTPKGKKILNALLIEIQMPVIEQTGIQVLSLTDNEVTQADFRNEQQLEIFVSF